MPEPGEMIDAEGNIILGADGSLILGQDGAGCCTCGGDGGGGGPCCLHRTTYTGCDLTVPNPEGERCCECGTEFVVRLQLRLTGRRIDTVPHCYPAPGGTVTLGTTQSRIEWALDTSVRYRCNAEGDWTAEVLDGEERVSWAHTTPDPLSNGTGSRTRPVTADLIGLNRGCPPTWSLLATLLHAIRWGWRPWDPDLQIPGGAEAALNLAPPLMNGLLFPLKCAGSYERFDGQQRGTWEGAQGCTDAFHRTTATQDIYACTQIGPPQFPGDPTCFDQCRNVQRVGEFTYNAFGYMATQRVRDCPTPPCPPTDELGACCYLNDFGQVTCAPTSRILCDIRGGVFTPGEPCGQPCPEFAACCLPDGSCINTTATRCSARMGVWHPGVLCGANPCGPPKVGACCAGGVCGVVSEADCLAAGGTYYGDGTTCADIPPCEPDPEYACCLPDGTCTTTTRAGCQVLGGTFRAGRTCGEVVCTATPDQTIIPPVGFRPGCSACGQEVGL